MQIKATVRYYLTSVRMTIKKSTKVGEDVEKPESLYTAGENETGAAIMENTMAIAPKIKNRAASWDPAIPFLGIYTKK